MLKLLLVFALISAASLREIQILKKDAKRLRLDIDNDERMALKVLSNLRQGMADKDAEIKMFQMDDRGTGNFSVAWETRDGKTVLQRGYLKPASEPAEPNLKTEANQTLILPNDTSITVEYNAGDEGFQPESTKEPLPESMQRSLDVIYKNFDNNMSANALRNSGPALVIYSEIILDQGSSTTSTLKNVMHVEESAEILTATMEKEDISDLVVESPTTPSNQSDSDATTAEPSETEIPASSTLSSVPVTSLSSTGFDSDSTKAEVKLEITTQSSVLGESETTISQDGESTTSQFTLKTTDKAAEQTTTPSFAQSMVPELIQEATTEQPTNFTDTTVQASTTESAGFKTTLLPETRSDESITESSHGIDPKETTVLPEPVAPELISEATTEQPTSFQTNFPSATEDSESTPYSTPEPDKHSRTTGTTSDSFGESTTQQILNLQTTGSDIVKDSESTTEATEIKTTISDKYRAPEEIRESSTLRSTTYQATNADAATDLVSTLNPTTEDAEPERSTKYLPSPTETESSRDSITQPNSFRSITGDSDTTTSDTGTTDAKYFVSSTEPTTDGEIPPSATTNAESTSDAALSTTTVAEDGTTSHARSIESLLETNTQFTESHSTNSPNSESKDPTQEGSALVEDGSTTSAPESEIKTTISPELQQRPGHARALDHVQVVNTTDLPDLESEPTTTAVYEMFTSTLVTIAKNLASSLETATQSLIFTTTDSPATVNGETTTQLPGSTNTADTTDTEPGSTLNPIAKTTESSTSSTEGIADELAHPSSTAGATVPESNPVPTTEYAEYVTTGSANFREETTPVAVDSIGTTDAISTQKSTTELENATDTRTTYDDVPSSTLSSATESEVQTTTQATEIPTTGLPASERLDSKEDLTSTHRPSSPKVENLDSTVTDFTKQTPTTRYTTESNFRADETTKSENIDVTSDLDTTGTEFEYTTTIQSYDTSDTTINPNTKEAQLTESTTPAIVASTSTAIEAEPSLTMATGMAKLLNTEVSESTTETTSSGTDAPENIQRSPDRARAFDDILFTTTSEAPTSESELKTTTETSEFFTTNTDDSRDLKSELETTTASVASESLTRSTESGTTSSNVNASYEATTQSIANIPVTTESTEIGTISSPDATSLESLQESTTSISASTTPDTSKSDSKLESSTPKDVETNSTEFEAFTGSTQYNTFEPRIEVSTHSIRKSTDVTESGTSQPTVSPEAETIVSVSEQATTQSEPEVLQRSDHARAFDDFKPSSESKTTTDVSEFLTTSLNDARNSEPGLETTTKKESDPESTTESVNSQTTSRTSDSESLSESTTKSDGQSTSIPDLNTTPGFHTTVQADDIPATTLGNEILDLPGGSSSNTTPESIVATTNMAIELESEPGLTMSTGKAELTTAGTDSGLEITTTEVLNSSVTEPPENIVRSPGNARALDDFGISTVSTPDSGLKTTTELPEFLTTNTLHPKNNEVELETTTQLPSEAFGSSYPANTFSPETTTEAASVPTKNAVGEDPATGSIPEELTLTPEPRNIAESTTQQIRRFQTTNSEETTDPESSIRSTTTEQAEFKTTFSPEPRSPELIGDSTTQGDTIPQTTIVADATASESTMESTQIGTFNSQSVESLHDATTKSAIIATTNNPATTNTEPDLGTTPNYGETSPITQPPRANHSFDATSEPSIELTTQTMNLETNATPEIGSTWTPSYLTTESSSYPTTYSSVSESTATTVATEPVERLQANARALEDLVIPTTLDTDKTTEFPEFLTTNMEDARKEPEILGSTTGSETGTVSTTQSTNIQESESPTTTSSGITEPATNSLEGESSTDPYSNTIPESLSYTDRAEATTTENSDQILSTIPTTSKSEPAESTAPETIFATTKMSIDSEGRLGLVTGEMELISSEGTTSAAETTTSSGVELTTAGFEITTSGVESDTSSTEIIKPGMETTTQSASISDNNETLPRRGKVLDENLIISTSETPGFDITEPGVEATTSSVQSTPSALETTTSSGDAATSGAETTASAYDTTTTVEVITSGVDNTPPEVIDTSSTVSVTTSGVEGTTLTSDGITSGAETTTLRTDSSTHPSGIEIPENEGSPTPEITRTSDRSTSSSELPATSVTELLTTTLLKDARNLELETTTQSQFKSDSTTQSSTIETTGTTGLADSEFAASTTTLDDQSTTTPNSNTLPESLSHTTQADTTATTTSDLGTDSTDGSSSKSESTERTEHGSVVATTSMDMVIDSEPHLTMATGMAELKPTKSSVPSVETTTLNVDINKYKSDVETTTSTSDTHTGSSGVEASTSISGIETTILSVEATTSNVETTTFNGEATTSDVEIATFNVEVKDGNDISNASIGTTTEDAGTTDSSDQPSTAGPVVTTSVEPNTFSAEATTESTNSSVENTPESIQRSPDHGRALDDDLIISTIATSKPNSELTTTEMAEPATFTPTADARNLESESQTTSDAQIGVESTTQSINIETTGTTGLTDSEFAATTTKSEDHSTTTPNSNTTPESLFRTTQADTTTAATTIPSDLGTDSTDGSTSKSDNVFATTNMDMVVESEPRLTMATGMAELKPTESAVSTVQTTTSSLETTTLNPEENKYKSDVETTTSGAHTGSTAVEDSTGGPVIKTTTLNTESTTADVANETSIATTTPSDEPTLAGIEVTPSAEANASSAETTTNESAISSVTEIPENIERSPAHGRAYDDDLIIKASTTSKPDSELTTTETAEPAATTATDGATSLESESQPTSHAQTGVEESTTQSVNIQTTGATGLTESEFTTTTTKLEDYSTTTPNSNTAPESLLDTNQPDTTTLATTITSDRGTDSTDGITSKSGSTERTQQEQHSVVATTSMSMSSESEPSLTMATGMAELRTTESSVSSIETTTTSVETTTLRADTDKFKSDVETTTSDADTGSTNVEGSTGGPGVETTTLSAEATTWDVETVKAAGRTSTADIATTTPSDEATTAGVEDTPTFEANRSSTETTTNELTTPSFTEIPENIQRSPAHGRALANDLIISTFATSKPDSELTTTETAQDVASTATDGARKVESESQPTSDSDSQTEAVSTTQSHHIQTTTSAELSTTDSESKSTTTPQVQFDNLTETTTDSDLTQTTTLQARETEDSAIASTIAIITSESVTTQNPATTTELNLQTTTQPTTFHTTSFYDAERSDTKFDSTTTQQNNYPESTTQSSTTRDATHATDPEFRSGKTTKSDEESMTDTTTAPESLFRGTTPTDEILTSTHQSITTPESLSATTNMAMVLDSEPVLAMSTGMAEIQANESVTTEPTNLDISETSRTTIASTIIPTSTGENEIQTTTLSSEITTEQSTDFPTANSRTDQTGTTLAKFESSTTTQYSVSHKGTTTKTATTPAPTFPPTKPSMSPEFITTGSQELPMPSSREPKSYSDDTPRPFPRFPPGYTKDPRTRTSTVLASTPSSKITEPEGPVLSRTQTTPRSTKVPVTKSPEAMDAVYAFRTLNPSKTTIADDGSQNSAEVSTKFPVTKSPEARAFQPEAESPDFEPSRNTYLPPKDPFRTTPQPSSTLKPRFSTRIFRTTTEASSSETPEASGVEMPAIVFLPPKYFVTTQPPRSSSHYSQPKFSTRIFQTTTQSYDNAKPSKITPSTWGPVIRLPTESTPDIEILAHTYLPPRNSLRTTEQPPTTTRKPRFSTRIFRTTTQASDKSETDNSSGAGPSTWSSMIRSTTSKPAVTQSPDFEIPANTYLPPRNSLRTTEQPSTTIRNPRFSTRIFRTTTQAYDRSDPDPVNSSGLSPSTWSSMIQSTTSKQTVTQSPAVEIPANTYLPPRNSDIEVNKTRRRVLEAALRLPDVPFSTAQSPDTQDSQVSNLRSTNKNYGNGSYSYSYDNSDGSSVYQRGYMKPSDSGQPRLSQAMEGYYQWNSPTGEEQRIQYTADENGYQAQGDGIPTSPPIPKAIQKSLEIIYRNAEAQKRKRSH